jgi:hypothetical protein
MDQNCQPKQAFPPYKFINWLSQLDLVLKTVIPGISYLLKGEV